MSDNPFAEPEDADRTLVRGPQRATQPSPAAAPAHGSAAAPAHGSAAAPARGSAPAYGPAAVPAFAPGVPPAMSGGFGAATPLAGEADAIPKVGMGPLAAVAAPLLDLLSRMAAGVQVANPGELRERAARGLRAFEADAREAGIAPDEIRAAHYALCAALDDVALSTPWGQGSIWSTNSLVSTFHQEVRAGDRFFDMLSAMQKDPGRYRNALEVSYLCLALGLQGRYRLARTGAADLDRIREGLYQLLTQIRGPWERELSPRWRGVDAPHRARRGGIPTWTAAALTIAILGLGYAWVSNALATRTDGLFTRLAGLPPSAPPTIQRVAPPQPVTPPPAPPVLPARPDLAMRLRQFLAPEIQQGLVAVLSDPNRTLVRISNRGMFPSGSASVDPRFNGLLARIGEALREEPGSVLVVGHSDNQPIRTARFPSNFHLSAARAQAAGSLIAAAEGGTPGRFTAEGRGEAEPIAANDTAEGREANRRIEVVISTPGRVR
jgi:type VI secretion system protein ImpK